MRQLPVIVTLVLLLLVPACASRQPAAPATLPPTAAATPTISDSRELAGTTWLLRELEGTSVTVPAERARPSLVFDAREKRVSGMAGVNRFGGTYTMSGQQLTFGPLLATKMAGPPELNAIETRYLRALARTTAWRVEGGELELRDDRESLARFSAGPGP